MIPQSGGDGVAPARRDALAEQLGQLSRLVDRMGSRGLKRALGAARVDFAPASPQPPAVAVVVATLLAIGLSLAADAAIVAIGTHLVPATKGYRHFIFSDYARLTIIGVLGACAGWPIVTRISSAPRWLYLRLAVLVSAVLLLPDVYLLVRGDPAKAVAILMVMHLAIAVVTYNCVVRIARVPRAARSSRANRTSG